MGVLHMVLVSPDGLPSKGFRLSRYPQKHSFVHVVADKQDLKLDVESFFFMHWPRKKAVILVLLAL